MEQKTELKPQDKKPAPKISVGRIVHFVTDADLPHQAAIVTEVQGDFVSLYVFGRSGNYAGSKTSVLFDADGKKARSWHWPERE